VGAASDFDQITTWAQISPAQPPDARAAARYDQIYPVYAGLYATLKADIDKLTALTAPEEGAA
jgi:hypothetical protein